MAAGKDARTAQCNLGIIYAILSDYAAAMRWFRKAANQGDAEDVANTP
jgi:TPR repeat protein